MVMIEAWKKEMVRTEERSISLFQYSSTPILQYSLTPALITP
jgi:hypothetical protein